jgi:hypothetical protein
MTVPTRTTLVARTVVEGFHRWERAPEAHAYLRARHRHLFHVAVCVGVDHDDRGVEFIELARSVKRYLLDQFATVGPAAPGEHAEPCEFGGRSCESIAAQVRRAFGARWVEVSEDGENGARVEAMS